MFSRAAWYEYLNEPSHKSIMAWLIYLLVGLAITVNMIELLLVSVERDGDGFALYAIAPGFFTFIFLVDYVLRVWVAAEAPIEHGKTATAKRAHYVFSPMGVVDLLSCLPGILLLISPENVTHDFSFLKVMTTIRILKLTRYSASLSILASVYRENFSTLFSAAIIMLILSFTAATGVYIFERHVQPEVFSSIPDAMWWALVTLTTVGYGDMVPITLGGKLFGGLVMIAGVGIAAIPAGVFASSFVRLIRERDRENRIAKRRKKTIEGIDASLRTIDLDAAERNEVEFLMNEYGLTLDQATSVVDHYRD